MKDEENIMGKVVLFGLGNIYEKVKDTISQYFDIVAVSDNDSEGKRDLHSNFVEASMISLLNFDLIIICSLKYSYSIWVQLIKMGIPSSKIIFANELIKLHKSIIDLKQAEDILNDIYVYSQADTEFAVDDDRLMFMPHEKEESAGRPPEHYFAQDIWCAKKIREANPQEHYDIGSRLDGFISHLLCFRNSVNYIDIRPLPYDIPGLNYIQGNAMELPDIYSNSLESVSCLHAIEHFGLGRYGDPIDANGHIKAAKCLCDVLMPGGRLYIGTPVGPKNRLVFNAHRIFTFDYIIDLFNSLELVDTSIVEPGSCTATPIDRKNYYDICDYSCGLFEFVKN